jgi:tetratricopeptide (TPR) repeat protein
MDASSKEGTVYKVRETLITWEGKNIDTLHRNIMASQEKHIPVETYQQTLEPSKEVLGSEHPDIVLSGQSEYVDAEQMDQQTLELRENVLDSKQLDTLMDMNNQALALSKQGKYVEAEEMQRQTLELRRKLLGLEHLDTLASMDNLAWVLSEQSKHVEAEEMQRQTLELRRKVLGLEHPDTLASLNTLARVLSKQGKYVEAEEMQRHVARNSSNAPSSADFSLDYQVTIVDRDIGS